MSIFLAPTRTTRLLLSTALFAAAAGIAEGQTTQPAKSTVKKAAVSHDSAKHAAMPVAKAQVAKAPMAPMAHASAMMKPAAHDSSKAHAQVNHKAAMPPATPAGRKPPTQ